MRAASARTRLAWDNCLQHGDSEEAEALLREGGRVEPVYACWDEFEDAPGDGRPDLGLVMTAGAELAARAAEARKEAFALPTDGTGFWCFLAASEDELVEELLRAGLAMESAVGSPG